MPATSARRLAAVSRKFRRASHFRDKPGALDSLTVPTQKTERDAPLDPSRERDESSPTRPGADATFSERIDGAERSQGIDGDTSVIGSRRFEFPSWARSRCRRCGRQVLEDPAQVARGPFAGGSAWVDGRRFRGEVSPRQGEYR
jgi:hypothetical protein